MLIKIGVNKTYTKLKIINRLWKDSVGFCTGKEQ